MIEEFHLQSDASCYKLASTVPQSINAAYVSLVIPGIVRADENSEDHIEQCRKLNVTPNSFVSFSYDSHRNKFRTEFEVKFLGDIKPIQFIKPMQFARMIVSGGRYLMMNYSFDRLSDDTPYREFTRVVLPELKEQGYVFSYAEWICENQVCAYSSLRNKKLRIKSEGQCKDILDYWVLDARRL